MKPIGVKSGHSPSGPFSKSSISTSGLSIFLLNPLVNGKKLVPVNKIIIPNTTTFFRFYLP